MSVEEALDFFKTCPRYDHAFRPFGTWDWAIKNSASLQQPCPEARRSASNWPELSKRSTGSTVYVLDEPTTGLHMADVHRLIEMLSVWLKRGIPVVIEHNLDVIKTADYIIDLGPEGGDMGGNLVFAGTPRIVPDARKAPPASI